MTRIPPQRREAMYRGSGYRCQACGQRFSPEVLTIDHVIPLAKGGKNKGNLQVLCRPCNARKGSAIRDYRRG